MSLGSDPTLAIEVSGSHAPTTSSVVGFVSDRSPDIDDDLSADQSLSAGATTGHVGLCVSAGGVTPGLAIGSGANLSIESSFSSAVRSTHAR